MKDQPPIRIALTCDVVHDYFDRSFYPREGQPPLSWRGIEEGVGIIIDGAGAFRDSFGGKPVFTWFVPVDNLIESDYGSSSYLLERFGPIWDKCSENGGEIAWHVYQHSYKRNFYPEESNEKWAEGLCRAYEDWQARGISPRTTRIGGTYCNSLIIQTLEALGIECDMTALPGRLRSEGRVKLDWRGTPEAPYYPSRKDYRIPGEPSHNLLEIPLSIAHVQADYDEKPFPRYIDLAFHHEILKPGLEQALKTAPAYLHTILHPSAILDGINKKRHGLLGFTVRDFIMNLEQIVFLCEKFERPFQFVNATELASAFGRATLSRYSGTEPSGDAL